MAGKDDPGDAGDQDLEPVPSIAELRERVLRSRQRIGTGWPVLDGLTGGIMVGRTTVVSAPDELRHQVLGRMAAWAAGESYRTLIASTGRSTEDLLLSVAAGGLGLPARVLLATTSHDAWLDARMRVLDLVAVAGPDAPARVADVMTSRRPAVMAMVDGYYSGEGENLWDRALRVEPTIRDSWGAPAGRFDPVLYPQRRRCALVLATPDDGHAEVLVPHAARYVRLQPRDSGSRVEITVRTDRIVRTKIVVLDHGLLPRPTTDARQVRRRGAVNIWEERLPGEVNRFADLLGAQAFDVEPTHDEETDLGPEGWEH